jgi:uncharacterized YigZ family protein
MPRYRTIAQPLRYEIEKIKGSRFIADVAPVSDDDAAEAFLAQVREAFPDATHHCSAWLIDPEHTRFSDDGEPSGSAGMPILRQLQGSGLVQVAAVVTRYYGGTKLGTGGLVRAYGAAARAALDAAEVVEHIITRSIRITHGYDLTAAVQSVLSEYHLEPVESTYETEVQLTLAVPEEQAEAFVRELGERTAQRVIIDLN